MQIVWYTTSQYQIFECIFPFKAGVKVSYDPVVGVKHSVSPFPPNVDFAVLYTVIYDNYMVII